VLGGLIDDQVNDTHDKVPFLGDIPLLGSLFRYRTSSNSKRNLMVFLHPTILRDAETADFYSRSKYDDFRSAQLGIFDEGDQSLSTRRPQLPELHMYFDGKRVFNNGKSAMETLLPTSDAAPASVSAPPPPPVTTAPVTTPVAPIIEPTIPPVGTPDELPKEVGDDEILGAAPSEEELLQRANPDAG
jgi:general secretion pathway protein D